MSVVIRPVHESDIPYLYHICLVTGDSGKDATALYSDPYLVGQYYAAPYLFFQKDLCFVAESAGIPQGYIIGAADTAAFNAWFESCWLPALRKKYPPDFPSVSEKERTMVSAVHRPVLPPDPVKSPWMEKYPAHLHIDIVSGFQGKGCGRALMEKFWEALQTKGVPGVHLGVGASNVNAIGFYRKLGFATLREESWGLVMGKDLGRGFSGAA